jgi:transcriptional regulator NrdR family protein
MLPDFSNLSPEQLEALIQIIQQQKSVVEEKLTFSTEVEKVREERINEQLNKIELNLKVYETINAAFEVALTQVTNNKEEAKWIVSKLDHCRQIDDFRRFTSVYRKYKDTDIKFEEMLKCLAAIYRLKVKGYYSHTAKYSDRAIVRKEIRCPHCGEMARNLVKFLAVRGIKWED